MTKEEVELIIAEQNKSKEEILKAIVKVKAEYHEYCILKDLQIADLKAQIEKMKCCRNCKHWNVPDDIFNTPCEECETCKNCSKWEIAECQKN